MSWLCTCINRLAVRATVAAIVLACGAGFASAQNLETAIMPGKLIDGHAKLEADCKNCHVRMDRSAQPRLCMDCHKEVAADVRARTGHHGRLKQQECRSCHTEHKGRDANIVPLEPAKFDHAQTDFMLRGKHTSVQCASCHRARAKYSQAPADCAACHRKNDKHKGGLGTKCTNCHDERGWKENRFDHATTKFPLAGSHADVQCTKCHVEQRFAGISHECASCHRKDDAHKGHFGARCETCHDSGKWKSPTFRHDADTRFPLRFRHRTAKCDSCHRRPPAQEKLATACVSCHRRDDAHKATLGEKCESCHSERGWKTTLFDHNRDARFALRGKHAAAKCEGCHKDMDFRVQPPKECAGCHAKDDRERGHKGQLGAQCSRCHNERAWKNTAFDHNQSEFPLAGRHAQIECRQCHVSAEFKDAKKDCASCHAKDDKHKEKLGLRCGDCHDPRGWKPVSFDHNAKSRFKLDGAHIKVECLSCHTAPVKDKPSLGIDCASCHAKDDRHKQRLGPLCADCHETRTWKSGRFDHNQKSRFKLAGAHVKVACISCHTAPLKDKPAMGMECASCHGRNDDVHFGSYGNDCGRCHVPENWRKVINPERAPRASPK